LEEPASRTWYILLVISFLALTYILVSAYYNRIFSSSSNKLRYRLANKSPVDAAEEEVLFDLVGSLVRPQPVCRVPVQQPVYQLPTRQANLHASSFLPTTGK
jgi:hypothetical protein